MLPEAERNDYPEPRMAATPQAVPQAVERPHAVPRENVSTEIWNLPNSLTLLRIFLVPFLVVVLVPADFA